jgi:hypothetical protein
VPPNISRCAVAVSSSCRSPPWCTPGAFVALFARELMLIEK